MTDARKRRILFIIDRSGSIKDIRSDMQGGFEHFVREQIKAGEDAGIETTATLWQFDTEHEQVFDAVPLSELLAYRIQPRGGTALLDAVGNAVVREGEKLAVLPEDERPGDVVVLVATDGLENSSKEWTKPRVRDLLTEQQEKYGWSIIYNGANQDSFAEAGSIGVAAGAVMDFNATPQGTQGSWEAASAMSVRAVKSGSYAYTDEERAQGKQ